MHSLFPRAWESAIGGHGFKVRWERLELGGNFFIQRVVVYELLEEIVKEGTITFKQYL